MRADRASNVEPPQKREAHVFSGEKQARKSSGVFAVVPHSGKMSSRPELSPFAKLMSKFLAGFLTASADFQLISS